MAPSTIVALVVSTLTLAFTLVVHVIEYRNNRKDEPQMIKNKAFLAMMNRLPLKGQRLAWVDFARGGYTEDEQADGRVIMDAPLEEANVITSLVDVQAITGVPIPPASRTADTRSDVSLHRPVVDIDHVVKVVESSTTGHSHLFIDLVMPWEDVVKLLEVMAEVGLVEPGYVNASKARGYTAVRLPWVSKYELSDEEVREA